MDDGASDRNAVKRWGIRTAGALALAAVFAVPALAQVGHRPESSPYRELRRGHTATAIFGQFGGKGGRFGIAPHDGQVYGLRYDVRTGSTIQIGLGFARGDLQRLIVDPFVALADRVSGPVDQTVSFVEANLQLNLTGGKSWHRLAPFVGSGVGLTFPSGTPQDTSRFELGKKLYLAPFAGVRVVVTNRLSLRGEARVVFLKLKYPSTFEDEPALEPGDPPLNSNAVITDGRTSEWTTSSLLTVGLGYSFSP
ncbi:MAG TPA: hypothetical protein VMY76_05065 [Gemmatimonadales bacterium]|nr:hypothetical protein [Gemmatimonadales bacterium]